MARLSRFTQYVFGSTAGNNQMSEYGSFATGTPATYSGSTITPTIVQTLSNYLQGWFAAVGGAYSPAIEDMNSICFLFGYQLTYLFQGGIPEWDSGTTYYTGSISQDGAGTLYSSRTNTNLNNALTSGTNWQAPSLPGVITPNSVPYTAGMTLQANQSMMWPYMKIASGQTVVVPDNAQLVSVGNTTVSGTGILQATGTGIIHAI